MINSKGEFFYHDVFNVSSPVVLTYNCAVCRGGGWGQGGKEAKESFSVRDGVERGKRSDT